MIGALIAGAVALPGCTSKKQRAVEYYKVAPTGRATAASAMAADWRAGKLLLDDCMDLAFDRLEAPGDAASLAFAGAVLDFAAQVQRELPQGDEYLLLYQRLGGLAGHAATVAYNLGDYPTGRSLVLAGPAKWQSDVYWFGHPNHDALVGRLMYLTGEEAQAFRWLRRHDDMDPELQRALGEITAHRAARPAPAPADPAPPPPPSPPPPENK